MQLTTTSVTVQVIWRHPETQGALYVGNASAAGDRATLEKIGVKRIVFCQVRPSLFALAPLLRYFFGTQPVTH